jgi:N-acetylmuramic acid 6-phosphate etherase
MVRIGKAYGNLMVDVQANSEKLKDRARRIVSIATGVGYDSADELLRRARWNVKVAVVMDRTGSSYAQATSKLKQAEGSTRDAVGEDIEPRLRALLHLDEPKGEKADRPKGDKGEKPAEKAE